MIQAPHLSVPAGHGIQARAQSADFSRHHPRPFSPQVCYLGNPDAFPKLTVRPVIVADHLSKRCRFISGHSAGGYLAAMLAMHPRYLEKHGLDTDAIAGVIPASGQMITHSTVRRERGIPRTTSIIDEAAPSHQARRGTPPFLNICGSQDSPARAAENIYFAAVMKAAGNNAVKYLEIEGRTHRTIVSRISEENDSVAQAILAFIRNHRR